jgi:ribose transport system permease protein
MKAPPTVNLQSVVRRGQPVIQWSQRNGLFFALVVMCVCFALLNDHFLRWQNWQVISQQVASIGIVAVPDAMLLMCGYVDLSVGSLAALSAAIFGSIVPGVPVIPAMLIALVISTAWGFMNGLLIAYAGFSPIVVTLGSLSAALGLGELIQSGVVPYGFGSIFESFGNGKFLSLTTPVYMFIGAMLLGAFAWYQTPLGRYLVAVGSDKNVSRSSGINVRAIPLCLYTLSGLAAALVGLSLASQLDSASLSIGTDLELQVLTAILLGGVSFVGGSGSLFGVLVGLLFVGVLDNGLIVIDISPYISDLAIGLALLFAAGLDVLYRYLDRIQLAELEDLVAAEEDTVEKDEVVSGLSDMDGEGT